MARRAPIPLPHPPALPALLAVALFAQDPVALPPSRALARELCAAPRLAGTSGSLRAARFVARILRGAGWRVEVDARDVCLSLPRRLELAVFSAGSSAPLLRRIEVFDPDAIPPGDAPRFNAWSASGRVRAPVVPVGRGLRADYEELAAGGLAVSGRIALARYGGAYRGVKAELAEEHGCAGLLLYSDAASDGPAKGPTWPAGPWKPPWAAQRGSISPLARAPGDPSTPGWPSPAPGEPGRRLAPAERDRGLPGIPCLPIGSADAEAILARIEAGEAIEVLLDVDQPRTVRTIRSVVATLPGRTEELVLAGNHRDAWVRGAQDAGSGTVSLLRAAQRLGERARAGWIPRCSILLGFWDGEELGLIGSTEWGEAHADMLGERAVVYVNADAVVSGPRLRASGTPGLLGVLRDVLERVPSPDGGGSLWEGWSGDGAPSLGLPGSGSDFAVFLHHVGVPILDVSFAGRGGGQYHTAFDDFPLMDRFLDPGWTVHETAGALLAELLAELAERGRAAFDDADAAGRMRGIALAAGEEEWLGEERARRLADAWGALEEAVAAAPEERSAAPPFYRALRDPDGLEGRPWFTNRLWAPGLETGYAAETLPGLRSAARRGEEALDAELAELVGAIGNLCQRWRALPAAQTTPSR